VWAEPVDAVFLVNWRYRVPEERMRGARCGAFVFHDSLLPRYRGFSPVVWAIANGEGETGATLFRLVEEIDAGPIVDQVALPIGPDETIAALFERVTEAYLLLVERNLPAILAGGAPGRAQEGEATYVRKRVPEDNRIDWSGSTASAHDLIRAVTHPYPGAYAFLDGQRVTIWAARRGPAARRDADASPGRVVEVRGDGAVVLTGDGSLVVEKVQLEGGPEVPAAELLAASGARLE
jgi:methionyl-tRNA formyltransferase